MIKGGKGGGNTITGLIFEGKTDLASFLCKQKGYSIVGHDVLYEGKKVASVYKKNDFYKYFLKELEIDWKNIFQRDCFLMTAFMF